MARPIYNLRGLERFAENCRLISAGEAPRWSLEEIEGPRRTYPVVTGRCPRCHGIVVLGRDCGKCGYRGTSLEPLTDKE